MSLKKVLKLGIKTQGASIRDWGHPDEGAGKFQEYFRVYSRKGKKCYGCKHNIARIVVGGRGTWICPQCQKA